MSFFKKKISNKSDEDLLDLYGQTNLIDYFGELYNRYIPLIYGLCLKYLQNIEKAEDATMELFEILLPKISGYEIKNFKTWIYSVTKNHCLQILRKEEQTVFVDFNAEIMESDPVLHLLEENGSEEEIAALKHCLEKLPKPQKMSISMFFIEEMSYADIAEQTGFLLKTVKSYIQNGKRNLKICIEKHQNV
ncbi:MAG: sigma-70 family RNA polymerase sigma factor [Candidatus Azobacteroides sp.]|nr:sigma-70 family RNA polymerase sigma factor [Candidatus Azobacteroides sp.]